MCETLLLCVGYYSYVWDTSTTFMCGITLSCVGYHSYVWDPSLIFGILPLLKNNNNNRSSPHSVRGDQLDSPTFHFKDLGKSVYYVYTCGSTFS